MSTLKFGLNIQKKARNAPSRPAPAKRKPVFEEEEEDDDPSPERNPNAADSAEEIGIFDLDSSNNSSVKPTEPTEPSKPANPTKPKAASTIPPQLKGDAKKKADPSLEYADLSSHQTYLKHAEEALALDPSIYDYDAAYDALHARTAARLAAERAEAQQRKPRYMDGLFVSAEVRKRDQLRAKDKVLAREREAEGDAFADKERFVTGAYKAQQAEVRRAEEEEERRRREEERGRAGRGMLGFYRRVMEVDERRHREVVEAA
ncbi:hypothetical protein AOQ84DRAFT_391007, partial [Glonium stellatum]